MFYVFSHHGDIHDFIIQIQFGKWILENLRENMPSRKIFCGLVKFGAAARFLSCFSIYFPKF